MNYFFKEYIENDKKEKIFFEKGTNYFNLILNLRT